MKQVALVGFGKTLRALMRALVKHPTLQVTRVHTAFSAQEVSELLRHDSFMGPFFASFEVSGNTLRIFDQSIEIVPLDIQRYLEAQKQPLDFMVFDPELAVQRAELESYLKHKIRRIFLFQGDPKLIDVQVFMGLNNMDFSPEHRIIAVGSGAAHALAAILHLLSQDYHISKGAVDIYEPYSFQKFQSAGGVLEGASSQTDIRQFRLRGNELFPTLECGELAEVENAFPNFNGLLIGQKVHVPGIQTGALRLLLEMKKGPGSRQEINEYVQLRAEMGYQKIVGYSPNALLSNDVIGNSHSCIFDAGLTKVHDNLLGLFLWYDNEWGVVNRLVELLELASYLRG